MNLLAKQKVRHADAIVNGLSEDEELRKWTRTSHDNGKDGNDQKSLTKDRK